MSITFQHSLTEITCASCGCCFAVPDHFQKCKADNGDVFYCPNGHTNHYSSRIQQLEKRLLETEASLRTAKCEVLAERNKRDQVERKLSRVKHGVCPCCKRSFTNLRRHMKTKHPEVVK